jgi:Activator of Hsp90 ATPase homolog 1-like protein
VHTNLIKSQDRAGSLSGLHVAGPDQLSELIDEGDPPPPPTHVTFTLAPNSEGTDVRVRHVGLGESEDWSRAIAWHERAWSAVLGNLEAHLAGRSLPRPWKD